MCRVWQLFPRLVHDHGKKMQYKVSRPIKMIRICDLHGCRSVILHHVQDIVLLSINAVQSVLYVYQTQHELFKLRGENFLKSCLLKSECISFYVHALIDWEANMNHTWIMISRVKIFFLIPSSQLDH